MPQWASLDAPGVLGGVQSQNPQVVNLATWCQRIESSTGWRQRDALAYTLVGAVPRVDPQIRVSGILGHQGLSREAQATLRHGLLAWATVTVHPWQLNEAAWAQLRQRVLRMIRHTGAPEYSPDDGRLLDLLPTVGLPPKGRGKGKRIGFVKHWKQVSAAWKVRYNQRVRWESLRMRWERFAKRHSDIVALIYAQDSAARTQMPRARKSSY